jgi:hypothetical protein
MSSSVVRKLPASSPGEATPPGVSIILDDRRFIHGREY